MHAPSAAPREIAVLKIVVFVAGAVLMALEILGSRVLAPRFGSSIYVWGSLISTFLVALSAGHKKIILYSVPGKEPFYRKFGFMRMRTAMAIFENQRQQLERGYLDET